ncbi:hypothetical protein Pint_27149 [Pistacia integerrima]|uniref:Uncharacterized protein n=1 Tax=Pistacia integerrima TaxID=434235 RepID=A0ACC0YNA4_9ROSI|nr:hypothetical protein Pint_27149 [Pistacia integerrima]
MLDNGNFVVYNESSDIIWSSFDYPTDTMLGGQNLYAGSELFSNVSKTNSSTGRFHLKMQEDGNLVFYCTVHDNQSIAVVFLKKIAENPVWKTAIVMPCSIRQGFCSKLKYPLKAFWRDSESSFTSYFKMFAILELCSPEIVSFRRNLDVHASKPEEIVLINSVYKYFINRELNKLVRDEEVDEKILENMVKVGPWCV